MLSGKVYHYDMGFMINGKPIPDPQKYKGATSALDTLGERDLTGSVHRNMVAEKHHPSVEYENIDWEMMRYIGSIMQGEEFYTFSFPDPFAPGGNITITAYTGDWEWDCNWAPTGGAWIGNLKFNVIEK